MHEILHVIHNQTRIMIKNAICEISLYLSKYYFSVPTYSSTTTLHQTLSVRTCIHQHSSYLSEMATSESNATTGDKCLRLYNGALVPALGVGTWQVGFSCAQLE